MTFSGTVEKDDLAILFREEGRYYVRLAHSYTRNEDLAYDVVQAAFEKALHKRQTYTGQGSLKAWMASIVVNEAKNQVTRQRLELVGQVDDEVQVQTVAMGPAPLSPEDSLGLRQDMRLLAAAYDRLPDRQREVLRLRIELGYSHQDIAAALGISAVDARVTYHLAVKKLKQFLDEADVRALPATEGQEGG